MNSFEEMVNTVLIESKVKEILNEELSVSDDVIKATSIIEKEIYDKLKTNEFVNGTMTFIVNNNIGDSFSNINSIQVTIVEITDSKHINYYIDGDYNKKTHILRFVLPYYNGELNDVLIAPTISHELLHALQYNKGEQRGYKDLYALASRMSDTLTPETANYDLSYCVYYLDKREIDARSNELAMALLKEKPKNMEEYSKMFLVRIKNVLKKKLVNLNEMEVAEYSYALTTFGIDRNKLFKYLNNQMRYLEGRFMKVWQWYLYKKDNVDENIRFKGSL